MYSKYIQKYIQNILKREEKKRKDAFKRDGTKLKIAEMRQILQIGWGPLKEQSLKEIARQIKQKNQPNIKH